MRQPGYQLAQHDRRQGMTLFELMIALAVVTVLISIVFPAAQMLLNEHSLKSSVEEVREMLSEGRNQAIADGTLYHARFEPYGQNFIIMVADVGLATTAGTDQQLSGAAPTSSTAVWKYAGEVPEEFQFRYLDGSSVEVTELPLEMFTGFRNPSELAKIRWGPPIEFRPDGTADDAVIDLFDPESKKLIQILIRGFTGNVSTTRVFVEDSPL